MCLGQGVSGRKYYLRKHSITAWAEGNQSNIFKVLMRKQNKTKNRQNPRWPRIEKVTRSNINRVRPFVIPTT
jgi:hypothetical protein